jgi:hypothetical protein
MATGAGETSECGPQGRSRCSAALALAALVVACAARTPAPHMSATRVPAPQSARPHASDPAVEQLQVTRDNAQLTWLEGLYDDPRATVALSAAPFGVLVSLREGRLALVGRFADWKQGGEAPNPPPLVATRLLMLQGLEPAQREAVVDLAIATMAVEDQRGAGGAPASLKEAIERAAPVLRDVRASPDCRPPCQAWSWQTLWSIFSTSARAEWRQGSRYEDALLLSDSEAHARRAASVVPASTHPLTAAVSERLLGAVQRSLAAENDDETMLARSLAANERALASFVGERYRYDWAVTQQNLLSALGARMNRSASPTAVSELLAVSHRVLALFDERTPKLRAQALVERARLLQSRYSRSGSRADLDEAVRLVEQAATTPGVTASTLAIVVAAARCELNSEVAARQDDVAAMKRAVAHCEPWVTSPKLPEESEPDLRRGYGLALVRLGYATGDVDLVRRGVGELERAIEAADRSEGRRAGVKTQADYGLGLLLLSRVTGSAEVSRKAVSVISEALELTSARTAPVQWGQLKHRQGLALLDLGWKMRAAFQMEQAIGLYQEGRAAFDAAVGTFSKNDNPSRWADLQRAIGLALGREAESKPPDRRDLINKSVDSYQRALSVTRREDDPDGFAQAQLGLGSTYLIAADSRVKRAAKDAATLAATAFRLALEVYEKSGRTRAAAHAKAHLADAVSLLQLASGKPSCDAVLLRIEAVAAYPHAAGLWTPAQYALDRLDRSYFSRARCPQLPPSFWDRAPKPQPRALDAR